MLNAPDLPPAEQLQALEDAYAELLMEDAGVGTLAQLWNNIKALRKELSFPIYEYVTPAELRE